MSDLHSDMVICSDGSQSESSFRSAQSTIEGLSCSSASPPILRLPQEILHLILSYLQCQQLVSVLRTCRALKTIADGELLWTNLLKEQIPARDFPTESPYPSPSYRHLYTSHHPYWFLPKYKIWISDEPHVGKLMLCRFDSRRGCIEGYRLLADRGPATGSQWEYNQNVLIHEFVPRVHLWLDDPVLNLPHDISPSTHNRQGWWDGEIRMTVGRSGNNTSASFFLALDLPAHLQSPSTEVWPPRTIPDMPRTRASSGNKFRGQGHKPQKYDQISQTTFRMRHWSQFFNGFYHLGVRLGEEVSTWSTLDPSLYTPTKRKPYQGIFVGDYAGHGCEFLLVLQTDQAPALPPESTPSEHMQMISQAIHLQLDKASEQLSRQRPHRPPVTPNLDDDAAHTGALEAIKLTGDPNIPRGEHTFIADDIGPGGLIRIAHESPFRGARVVKSRGHVAARGFQNDEFIPSQLIMMSPDRMAQYWVPFGHISYYERIDIDDLLSGTSYRRASQ